MTTETKNQRIQLRPKIQNAIMSDTSKGIKDSKGLKTLDSTSNSEWKDCKQEATC